MAAKIFYAGSVNIGRRSHWNVRERNPFENIAAMKDADLRIVNLLCVVSSAGEIGVDKGGNESYYYRARPEQLNILTNANVDVVLTANNHSGDYGATAISEQLNLLAAAGISQAGSGNVLEQATRPTYVQANDLIVAIFSVDTTVKTFAATEERAGTWFIPLDDVEQWRAAFVDRIAEARRFADVIFVAINWQDDADKPTEAMKTVGRLLIDCGADAVLGNHSKLINFVGKHNEHPIIYGAGNFLFDINSPQVANGCFVLTADKRGIKKINFTPLRRTLGIAAEATEELAEQINNAFIETCRELRVAAKPKGDGTIEIKYSPTSRGKATKEFVPLPPTQKYLIEPMSVARPEWIVPRVPEDAVIRPQKFGAVTLLGHRVTPECRIMTQRQNLCIETFWTIEKPVKQNFRLLISAVPEHECKMPPWGRTTEHDFLDWMFPVNRWQPNVVYREIFVIRPPRLDSIVNVDLCLDFTVRQGSKVVGKYLSPPAVEMHLPGKACNKRIYPATIFQSKWDQLWTAKQLADITDGKWVVGAPKDWFVQSVAYDIEDVKHLRAPVLFTPPAGFWNAEELPELPEAIGGLIVAKKIEGVPSELPQLQVVNPSVAVVEIGYAARKRFQGTTIGVTGSAGKATAAEMLDHILSETHSTFRTYRGKNVGWCPVVFASVPPTTSYAVIEMASGAFDQPRGSVTYDLPPDIAVVTSVAADNPNRGIVSFDIAALKCKILDNMSEGSYVVFNRDMPCYEMFDKKARDLKLNVITFGRNENALIQMPKIINGGKFTFAGNEYVLKFSSPNKMAHAALAAIAAAIIAGVPIETALKRLESF